jgi:hypothetical protein
LSPSDEHADDDPISLLIAVAASPAERLRLAERLEGIAPVLLVADLDALRRLLSTAERAPDGKPPTSAVSEHSADSRPAPS